jgi:hypothetical protein
LEQGVGVVSHKFLVAIHYPKLASINPLLNLIRNRERFRRRYCKSRIQFVGTAGLKDSI